MKKLVAVIVVLLLLVMVAPAFADPPDHGYGWMPGDDVAGSHTECYGHGSFGAFGEQGDIVHDFGVNYPGSNGEPGANGYLTGLNNSALCGNRQSP